MKKINIGIIFFKAKIEEDFNVFLKKWSGGGGDFWRGILGRGFLALGDWRVCFGIFWALACGGLAWGVRFLAWGV